MVDSWELDFKRTKSQGSFIWDIGIKAKSLELGFNSKKISLKMENMTEKEIYNMGIERTIN